MTAATNSEVPFPAALGWGFRRDARLLPPPPPTATP